MDDQQVGPARTIADGFRDWTAVDSQIAVKSEGRHTPTVLVLHGLYGWSGRFHTWWDDVYAIELRRLTPRDNQRLIERLPAHVFAADGDKHMVEEPPIGVGFHVRAPGAGARPLAHDRRRDRVQQQLADARDHPIRARAAPCGKVLRDVLDRELPA